MITDKIEYIGKEAYYELEKEAYRYKGLRIHKNYSFQIQAILEMVPGDAIVLVHDGYKCKYLEEPNVAAAACGVQKLVDKHVRNVVGRHMHSTGYKYESLHVDNNQRVAVLCIKEGEENGTTSL